MRSLVLCCLFATAARADDVPRIEVAVGDKAERDVAIANGYLCDDPTLISVEMRTRSQSSNLFIVTGLKEGKTLCRVGTGNDRVHFLFTVEVVAKAKPPAKKEKPKPEEPEPPSSPPIEIQP
jgi:hypothetical protein